VRSLTRNPTRHDSRLLHRCKGYTQRATLHCAHWHSICTTQLAAAAADPALAAAVRVQMNEFGRTPAQLFRHPHPARAVPAQHSYPIWLRCYAAKREANASDSRCVCASRGVWPRGRCPRNHVGLERERTRVASGQPLPTRAVKPSHTVWSFFPRPSSKLVSPLHRGWRGRGCAAVAPL
jgi:hypothetical protein